MVVVDKFFPQNGQCEAQRTAGFPRFVESILVVAMTRYAANSMELFVRSNDMRVSSIVLCGFNSSLI
jgi:hypothetical protein